MFKGKLILITAFVMLFSILNASGKRAVTFKDFFSMKRLGSVALSPDKSTIAYTLKIPNIEENNFKTDICLLDLKTKKTRQFTNDEKSSSAPVWSNDSKALYFNRDGQIWKKDIKGDSADQVTHFAPGAGGIVLNSGGSKMLFTSEVYPDCADEDCNKKKMEEAENSKVKARVIDHLMYRHWNRWLEGKRSHVFLADVDGKNVVDMTPGDYDAPPLSLGGANDYTFSPDGKEICFVRNIDKIAAASTNNDLFIASIADGKITKLTDNPANDNNPNYSPDGRYIAFASMERPGFEADKYRLMLFDRKKKTFTDLTNGFNLSAASILWGPSGKEIYFRAAEKGSYSLYKVDIKSAKISNIFKGRYFRNLQFINDNEIICKKQTASMPCEIFKMNLKDKKAVQISEINSELLAQLEMPAYEEFWFEGAKGDQVQGFILKPPFFNPDKKYPAIQLIHGGPQGAWGDDFHFRWNYQMFAAPGYVLYMINFHGSSGYGQDFCDAVSKDWGGAPYEDIKKGTEYVLKNYKFIDGNRLGAAGASYGGFMVNWIAGDENPYKCLISHDGVYDQVSMYGATEELWFPEWEFNGTPWDKESQYRKWSPSERAKNFKTPTLVIHGEHDYRVPYTQGMQMFTALQRQGVKSKLLFFPDEDHFVQKPQNARLWWKTVHEWFAEFLMQND